MGKGRSHRITVSPGEGKEKSRTMPPFLVCLNRGIMYGMSGIFGEKEKFCFGFLGMRCHLEISVGCMSLRGREGVWNEDLDLEMSAYRCDMYVDI